MNSGEFRNAVILRHDENGAKPVLSADGKSLSPQTAHAIAYSGRKEQWEQKGGCEREATVQDLELMRTRGLSDDALRSIRYSGRRGEFAAKGEAGMVDASWWGQDGPLSAEEIKRDMEACGGAFIESIVSVRRSNAAELGLDSKDALQRLVRANWRAMMMEGGIAMDRSDIHWFASYHTDAPNSVHVHVYTYVANTPLPEGWRPSGGATRRQVGMLYRDAYMRPRKEHSAMQDYHRNLLIGLAHAEMGYEWPAEKAERLRCKAARLGLEAPRLERTLDGKGQERVAAKEARLKSAVGNHEAHGHLYRNYRGYSAAKDLVDELRRSSAPMRRAYDWYMAYLEDKADMKGLAVPEKAEGETENQRKYREEAGRLRSEFVRGEVDALRKRIAFPLMVQNSLPDRMLRDAKEATFELRQGLLDRALDPGNPVGMDPQAHKEMKAGLQQILRELGAGAGQGQEGGGGLAGRKLSPEQDEAVRGWARAIAQSGECSAWIGRNASRMLEASEDRGRLGMAAARQWMTEAVGESMHLLMSARLKKGSLAPFRQEAMARARAMARDDSRGVVRELLSSQGLSAGMGLREFERFKAAYEEAVKGPRLNGEASPELVDGLAKMLAGAPRMQEAVERYSKEAAEEYGEENAPKSADVAYMMLGCMKRSVEGSLSWAARAGEQGASPAAHMPDLGLSHALGQFARQLVQERARPYGGSPELPRPQARKERRKKG